MSFWNGKKAKRIFKELPFCNVLNEKPSIKHLNNINILRELPFYHELSIVKISKTSRGYTRSYSIKIIEPKDPSAQLKISKGSIKYFFKDLLE